MYFHISNFHSQQTPHNNSSRPPPTRLPKPRVCALPPLPNPVIENHFTLPYIYLKLRKYLIKEIKTQTQTPFLVVKAGITVIQQVWLITSHGWYQRLDGDGES